MLRVLFLFLAILFSGCGDHEFLPYNEDVTREVASAESEPAMSITGWSKTANLRSFNAGQKDSLQADFDDAGGAGTFTVQFDIFNFDPDIGPINPIAVLDWSVEGNSVRRVISVSSGTSITGVGSAVKVTVYDDNPNIPLAVPPSMPQPYQIGITIAPGVRATTPNPPHFIPWITSAPGVYLLGVHLLGAASFVDVDVPQGYGVNSVEVIFYSLTPGSMGDPPSADIAIVQFDSTGVVGLRRYTPYQRPGWVTLIPQCKKIRIINLGALASVQTSIAFGVDG
jgi:hypothetical protein